MPGAHPAQAGVITALDAAAAKAMVFLPLLKLETGWIPVATNLLFETGVSLQAPVVNSGTIERPPGETSISFTKISAASGSASGIRYGTLKVGDQVVVIFLNGDLNQGVVIARLN
ncbi:MAG: hypothetical protein QME76_12410 [Bacillota bacterium]|nr:hypothetical protein [Bacillota bacterium]